MDRTCVRLQFQFKLTARRIDHHSKGEHHERWAESCGQSFELPGTDADDIRRLPEYVDSKMRTFVGRRPHKIDNARLSILAALDITLPTSTMGLKTKLDVSSREKQRRRKMPTSLHQVLAGEAAF